MSLVVLDPGEVAIGRTELPLLGAPEDDPGSGIRVEVAGLDWGDAAIQTYLADQRMGSGPVDYRIPNRTIKIPLGLGMDDVAGSFDTQRQQLQAKIGRLQTEGGWLKRQLLDGSHVFADVINATLKFPDQYGNKAKFEPNVSIELECLPDFYGDEITLDTLSGTALVNGVLKLGGAQAVIKGDYPGRVRIIVNETSGNDKNALLWAFRSRKYDAAATAAEAYECEALTPLDAATVQVQTGASGGSVVKHPGLSRKAWTPVLSTKISGVGDMTHRGTYRVWLRYTTAAKTWIAFQLLWGIGDVAHPVSNAIVGPPNADWFLVDLGTVRLDAPPLTSYSWRGVIQAIAGRNGADVELDRLIFQPLDEGAGWLVSKAPTDQSPAASGIMMGPNSPSIAADNAGTGTIVWNSPSSAQARDGHGAYLSFTAGGQTTHYLVVTGFGFNLPSSAVIQGIKVGVRRSSTNGYVWDNRVRLVKAGTIQATDRADSVRYWIAGDWEWKPGAYGGPTDTWGGGWLYSDLNASGFGVAISAQADDVDDAAIDVVHVTVYYTTSGGLTLVSDAVVYANRQAEIRTDGAYRQDSAGTVWGNIAIVGGDLPRIPTSGVESRAVELLARATRLPNQTDGDFSSFEDPALDTLSVQVKYRPAYLFRP